MRVDQTSIFGFDSGLTMLNHASYGVPTVALSARAEVLRRRLERDPNTLLGESLRRELADASEYLAGFLGLGAAQTAITANATEAAAAITASLPLRAGQVVVTLDGEYESVRRGWAHRCEQVGARLVTATVPLPVARPGDVIDILNALPVDDVAIVQVSAITSSTAVRLPVAQIAHWAHARGAVLVVDAAHIPGHQDLAELVGADVIFGDVHKWVPVPRSVGFVWARRDLVDLIKPAAVSLAFDAPTLAGRFSWPGTFDPSSRLCLPEAIATWNEWSTTGALDLAEALADRATDALRSAGAVPTAGGRMRPARMRAFLLPGVGVQVLRRILDFANVRAWTGTHLDESTILRLATHVYTDERDVDLVAQVVTDVLAAR